jgi:hypothetical protein
MFRAGLMLDDRSMAVRAQSRPQADPQSGTLLVGQACPVSVRSGRPQSGSLLFVSSGWSGLPDRAATLNSRVVVSNFHATTAATCPVRKRHGPTPPNATTPANATNSADSTNSADATNFADATKTPRTAFERM